MLMLVVPQKGGSPACDLSPSSPAFSNCPLQTWANGPMGGTCLNRCEPGLTFLQGDGEVTLQPTRSGHTCDCGRAVDATLLLVPP